MYIKKYIRESVRSLLNEKLTNVEEDVDLIYKLYFKTDIDTIEKTGLITHDMFKPDYTHTSVLISAESIKCNELKPCEIKINGKGNFYNPIDSIISVGISRSSIDFVMDYGDGVIDNAIHYLEDERLRRGLPLDFKEERVKGTIHHELVHWIDDTLHNKHLTNRINKARERGTRDLKGIPVNSTKSEIQGQIHNIKQLYNKHKDIWDTITFDEMLRLSSVLSHIYNSFNYTIRNKWRKEIRIRMHREGLLGKKMV